MTDNTMCEIPHCHEPAIWEQAIARGADGSVTVLKMCANHSNEHDLRGRAAVDEWFPATGTA